MANKNQTGYFKIDHSDLDGSRVIVPQDEAGDAPSGEPNEAQESYDISSDGEAHDYYVHVYNSLNENLSWNIKQSHMFDEDLSEADEVFGTDRTVNSGGNPDSYSGDENASKYGVVIDPAADPTSGHLIVVIQKSSV